MLPEGHASQLKHLCCRVSLKPSTTAVNDCMAAPLLCRQVPNVTLDRRYLQRSASVAPPPLLSCVLWWGSLRPGEPAHHLISATEIGMGMGPGPRTELTITGHCPHSEEGPPLCHCSRPAVLRTGSTAPYASAGWRMLVDLERSLSRRMWVCSKQSILGPNTLVLSNPHIGCDFCEFID